MKRTLTAIALLLALGAVAAYARVKLPSESQPARQYIEVVSENKTEGCTADCFVEYILLDNGTVIHKKFDTAAYETTLPAFSVRRADPGAAKKVFTDAASAFAGGLTESGALTDPFNLYFFDGEKHHAWSARKPGAEFKSAYDAIAALHAGGRMTLDFYVHEYFQPLDGGTRALHLFFDGTIIESVFDRRSYRMTSTNLSRLGAADLETAKDLAAQAHGEKPAAYFRCDAKTGLEYGLVEFINGGNLQKSYTCGEGDGPVQKLFRFIRGFGAQ